MVECAAHNCFVAGSNPAEPIITFKNMEFNFKNYKLIKLKKYLRKKGLFFLFDSIKLNKKKWIFNEQNLKKLKLKYYKPSNKITIKIFDNSIYKNFGFNIVGFIFFVCPCQKQTELKLFFIIKFLKPSFILISIKLNNRIYSIAQIKRLNSLSYNENIFFLYKILNKQLKISYILTNKKKTRNNVI